MQFRMPRSVYKRLNTTVMEQDPFFVRRSDAIAIIRACMDVKIFVGLMIMNEGRYVRSLVQQTSMKNRQIMLGTKTLVKDIVNIHET